MYETMYYNTCSLSVISNDLHSRFHFILCVVKYSVLYVLKDKYKEMCINTTLFRIYKYKESKVNIIISNTRYEYNSKRIHM